jgi:hypothetical protein
MQLKTIWAKPITATWTGDGEETGLEGNTQITAEEAISYLIFDRARNTDEGVLSEEDCADLGREILLMIACELRPDLVWLDL